jgi:hypothetical protein
MAEAGAIELDGRLLPDLASALGMTREEFDAVVARDFPAVSAGLDAMPDVLARYEDRVAIRVGGADDLRTLKQLPLGLLGWFNTAFAVLLAAVLAWAALALRRPFVAPARPLDAPEPPGR